jgi:hypothetical protein
MPVRAPQSSEPLERDTKPKTEEHDGESGLESRDLRGRVRCLAHAVTV